jgi:hypothetical protein
MTDPETNADELERLRNTVRDSQSLVREAAQTLSDVVMRTAAEKREREQLRPGSIVQVTSEYGLFSGCLVVVTEVRSWGVIGYVRIPGKPGLAYIRLDKADFTPTGGVAPWLLDFTTEEGSDGTA